MTLEERIITVLQENLEKRQEIKLTSRLAEDLHVDSLDKMMIIGALEDEFSTTIDEDDFADVLTVNDIVERIKSRQG
ncbi:MAG: phosphopantetheine-binding protein [Desulfitobacteriaceae bacterium]|nr:phosphopantetheine-binding protein [Desulfitobacteriaceae bacterium]